MKYIKLFEQFDEEDWWDKESPFDKIKDLKIIRGGSNFYLTKDKTENPITIFDDKSDAFSSKLFDLNPKFDIGKNKIIILSEEGWESTHNSFYKDLPQEIKDRIQL